MHNNMSIMHVLHAVYGNVYASVQYKIFVLFLAVLAPSMSTHHLYCSLVFWYEIVGPLELYLGHEDETNRPNAVRS